MTPSSTSARLKELYCGCQKGGKRPDETQEPQERTETRSAHLKVAVVNEHQGGLQEDHNGIVHSQGPGARSGVAARSQSEQYHSRHVQHQVCDQHRESHIQLGVRMDTHTHTHINQSHESCAKSG